jgi:hypothetical protein
MGVIFGTLFVRWRRTNPMIIAHTLPAAHVSWLP